MRDITSELEWINFCEAKRIGDSRRDLVAFFGSATLERLEARYRLEHPTPMERAIDAMLSFNPASVLK